MPYREIDGEIHQVFIMLSMSRLIRNEKGVPLNAWCGRERVLGRLLGGAVLEPRSEKHDN